MDDMYIHTSFTPWLCLHACRLIHSHGSHKEGGAGTGAAGIETRPVRIRLSPPSKQQQCWCWRPPKHNEHKSPPMYNFLMFNFSIYKRRRSAHINKEREEGQHEICPTVEALPCHPSPSHLPAFVTSNPISQPTAKQRGKPGAQRDGGCRACLRRA